MREETGWRIRIIGAYRAVIHHYTRYRVTLHGFLAELAPGQAREPVLTAAMNYAWVSLGELAEYPYPAGHRLLLESLVQGSAG